MAKPATRIAFLQGVLGVAAAAVLARSFMLQVVQHKQWEALAKAQRSLSRDIPARRGRILDRYGNVLAISEERYRISVALNEIKDTTGLETKLVQTGRLTRGKVEKAFEGEYPSFYGPFTAEEVASIRDLHGVTLEVLYDRVYPRKALAVPLLGHLNQAGDGGIEGLEKSLDTLLRGTPGRARYQRDIKGNLLDFPGTPLVQPIPGRDVVVTLDAEVQGIAESVLQDAVAKFQAHGGDVVILDVKTGEIFGMASLRLDTVKNTIVPNAAAIIEPYEPGSTSKLFTAAAVLQYVSDTSPVFAENGLWMMPMGRSKPRKIEDAHPVHGMITLGETIQHSSNIGISKFALRLKPEQQYSTIRNFGFGSRPGVDFPGEVAGRLPHPPWANKDLTGPSLGQGYEWLTSALQLAVGYAAIANHGVLLTPTLLKEVRDSDRVVWRHRVEVVRQAVPEAIASHLMEYLKLAADSEGTGYKAQLARYSIVGKTGTAMMSPYVPGNYRASFAGIFPGDAPQWVVYMMLDHPRGPDHFGAGTAAPMVRLILQQALTLQRSPLDRSRLTAPAATLPPATIAVHGSDTARHVPLPIVHAVAETTSRTRTAVPSLVGSSARAAVLALNQLGFEVHLLGRGKVRSTSPSAGDSLARGETVTVRADSLK